MRLALIRPIFAALCVPAALVAQQPAPASAAQHAMQPNDWHRVTTLSTPAMSPDGKRVAFTVTTVVERENKRHSEVWVVPTTGGEPVRWTSPGYESTNPRWSWDGKLLFFNSARPLGRGANWALHVDEPGGEAFQPENAEPVGSMPKDRSVIVYAAADTNRNAAAGGRGGRGGFPGGAPEGGRGAGAMNTPPFGSITTPVDQARFDGRHIVNFPYKANGVGYVPNSAFAPVRPRVQQVIVFTRATGRRAALTATAYSHRDVTVSLDGKWIAFVADAQLRSDSLVTAINDSINRLPFDRAREDAPRNDNDVYVMPAAGGDPRKVLSLQGDESDVQWSPDSRRLSFISRPSRTKNAVLMAIDVAGGAPQNLTEGWQYEPATYNWLPTGEIEMSATIGGRSALFVVTPKTAKMREVIGGRREVRGWSLDEKMRLVAFVVTSVSKPTELFIADWDGRNEHRATSFNVRLNEEIAWSDADRFTYESVGGRTVEGWLMKPYGYVAGKRYPLVLYIHGGPHSGYNEGWFDEFQNLAGAGMWVLYTNPRGSSGYGGEFAQMIRGRWGDEDYMDLMKAVDIATARPDVDGTKLGVTGGSYGGFMTTWITTKTERFKAAQADRMIVNWVSWYGNSDVQNLTEGEFYGTPWQQWDSYINMSPIKYADKVKTPTLLVQSEEDYRAPIEDADQWFMALKKNNVPAEFVRYPRSNHDLSRTGEPWLLTDRLSRIRQWFSYWLKDEKPQRAK
jgi:dipeptidyl aminopeptidase/acylaminoacyl peptidase